MPGADEAVELGERQGEDLVNDDAGSGFLSTASRRAAVAAALPLVATYFVRSDTLTTSPTNALAARSTTRPGRVLTDPDQVLSALRLRVALTAGAELADVLRSALRAANFRYALVRDEHLGHLHGRLDVPRYLQQRARRSVPRRYPVIDLQRSGATPENMLAAFALSWLLAELDACTSRLRLIGEFPEARSAARLRAELRRLRTHPVLRDVADDAAIVARRETVGHLLDRVEARIRAGHVLRSSGYEQLAKWARRTITQTLDAKYGNDLAAEFYDARFDDKLFELWCVSQLTRALTALLGEPRHSLTHMLTRDPTQPMSVWDAGADVIELFFQPSLNRLVDAANRWTYRASGRELRGFPDLGVRCRHVDGTAEVVLIDAKLRRRGSAHGQELYKLLGYTANAGIPVRYGALVFHAPAGFHSSDRDRHSTLDGGLDGGRIELVAVDPSDTSGSPNAFAVLANLVLTATGVADDALDYATPGTVEDPDADSDERAASRAQALATAQLENMTARHGPTVLKETATTLETLLDQSWPLLGEQVQRMATSAVYFGVQAPEGVDLAGPVLGLCSSLERLIRDRLAVPALERVRHSPGCDPERWTLGTLIMRLREAVEGGEGRAARELARHLAREKIDQTELEPLLVELDSLRSHHRNKAAHQGLIERAQWREVYRLVVFSDRALLPRLTGLLPTAE